jgi:hypothetical protein
VASYVCQAPLLDGLEIVSERELKKNDGIVSSYGAAEEGDEGSGGSGGSGGGILSDLDELVEKEFGTASDADNVNNQKRLSSPIYNLAVGLGTCCSPRHRMLFNSRNEGLKLRVDDTAGNLCQTLPRGELHKLLPDCLPVDASLLADVQLLRPHAQLSDRVSEDAVLRQWRGEP